MRCQCQASSVKLISCEIQSDGRKTSLLVPASSRRHRCNVPNVFIFVQMKYFLLLLRRLGVRSDAVQLDEINCNILIALVQRELRNSLTRTSMGLHHHFLAFITWKGRSLSAMIFLSQDVLNCNCYRGEKIVKQNKEVVPLCQILLS